MKKLLLLTVPLLTLVLLSFSNKSGQKKPFEGIITYTLKYTGAPQPPYYELYIKGSKWRRVLPSGINTAHIGDSTVKSIYANTIYIGDTNAPEKVIQLRELFGCRFLILGPLPGTSYTKHFIDSVRRRPNRFIYTSETKVISGYSCKKLYTKAVLVQHPKDTLLNPFYYTEEIPDYWMQTLPGLPMQIRTFPPDSNTTYIVTSVIEKSLPDSLFVATPSYRPI